MTDPVCSVFAFEEGDHLTRIHLKLALEDMGFVVSEEDETIHLLHPVDDDQSGSSSRPRKPR